MAQISVGLRESALGNSGAAITESTAPSFYNPALLSERKNSHFSLTGTTLTSFQSENKNNRFNSTKLAPNYISSIQAFEVFIHEFSLANQLSAESQYTNSIANGSETVNVKAEQYSLSYSFAFRDFPFGFQVGLRMNESTNQVNQVTDDGDTATGVNFNISNKLADMFFGFGGIHQIGSQYRFGYKYESRGLNVYNKNDQDGSYYFYNKTGNIFNSGKTNGSFTNKNLTQQSVVFGHSFTANNHEFLTDSRFLEEGDSNNTYSFYQTFGYKVSFSNKMQYMCGFSHRFESDIANLGESNYYSSGFSWMTNALRSTLSAYYFHQSGTNAMKSAGITFGSEFSY